MAHAEPRWRFRLLPTIACVASVLLVTRLVDLWDGVVVAAEPPAAAAQPKDAKPATPEKKPDAKPEAEKKPEPPKANANAGGPRSFDPAAATEAEIDVLQRLGARREELERRARDLDARDALLKAAEQRIDLKIGEMRKIEETVNALLKKHEEEQDTRLRSLVKIYENMKPKEAARIFEQLDMPILLDLVERMREAKVAQVIANLEPERAKAVTASLAKRRQLPDMPTVN